MDLLLIALGSINWNANHLFCPVVSVGDVGKQRNDSVPFIWLEWDDLHLSEEAETCHGLYHGIGVGQSRVSCRICPVQ